MTNDEFRATLLRLRRYLAEIEEDMTAADRTPFGDLGMLLDNSCMLANAGLDAIAEAMQDLDAED